MTVIVGCFWDETSCFLEQPLNQVTSYHMEKAGLVQSLQVMDDNFLTVEQLVRMMMVDILNQLARIILAKNVESAN